MKNYVQVNHRERKISAKIVPISQISQRNQEHLHVDSTISYIALPVNSSFFVQVVYRTSLASKSKIIKNRRSSDKNVYISRRSSDKNVYSAYIQVSGTWVLAFPSRRPIQHILLLHLYLELSLDLPRRIASVCNVSRRENILSRAAADDDSDPSDSADPEHTEQSARQ